jgi:hypothetical protein
MMFGILCSPKNESFFAETFYKLFKPLIKGKKTEIIVFSLSNTNLSEKTVYGSIITEEKITAAKAALPLLIFNFAIQYSRSDVKKCRGLMETDDVVLVNSANQYNQSAIMKMILSNNKFKRYILPFSNFERKDLISNFKEYDHFILKPANGTNLSKTIYSKQMESQFEIYCGNEFKSCHRLDIHDTLSPLVKKGKWILLKSPELLTQNNKLFVIRAYLQKNYGGEWKIILKTSFPQDKSFYEKFDKKINTTALGIVKYIGCFMPDLGFCFIDFSLSLFGVPCFLDFGGWDNYLLGENQDKEAQTNLCKNILEFARLHFEK